VHFLLILTIELITTDALTMTTSESVRPEQRYHCNVYVGALAGVTSVAILIIATLIVIIILLIIKIKKTT